MRCRSCGCEDCKPQVGMTNTQWTLFIGGGLAFLVLILVLSLGNRDQDIARFNALPEREQRIETLYQSCIRPIQGDLSMGPEAVANCRDFALRAVEEK